MVRLYVEAFGKTEGPKGPSKNTAIPHLSKRQTSLDLPIKTWKKSERVEEPRRLFQSSYCTIIPDAAQGALCMFARIERCNEYF